ncbi:LysM peptidoglycan-binding domain-containing protein [Candidatus Omnitrophota bacterium]
MAGSRTEAPDSYEDEIFKDNKGYVYQNEGISEERSRSKFRIIPFTRKEASPRKRKPRLRRTQTRKKIRPVRKKQISKPLKVKEPLREVVSEDTAYTRTLEDALLEERKTILRQEKEIEHLRVKLERAIRQLALATQKIMRVKKEEPVSKRMAKTYQVKNGDSLWSIAAKKEIYGNPKKWLLLYHANRDQIYDPNLIFSGMVLLIPRLDEYDVR